MDNYRRAGFNSSSLGGAVISFYCTDTTPAAVAVPHRFRLGDKRRGANCPHTANVCVWSFVKPKRFHRWLDAGGFIRVGSLCAAATQGVRRHDYDPLPPGLFVWMDVEYTTTDVATARILEVAAIITNRQLKQIGEPFSLACKPDDFSKHSMPKSVVDMHISAMRSRGPRKAHARTV